MRRANTIDILNELLVVHHRSLPMYLSYAVPWAPTAPNGTRNIAAVLDRLVADQKRYASKLAEAILARGGRIETGGFPMEFTDLHLLSLDYLLNEMVKYQRRDIAKIERAVELLRDDPLARELAEEALGNAKGHLDSLEECARGENSSTVKLHGSEGHV